MLGAIIGDIVGSRFEFNNYRSPEFELFHPDCTFTDDTICTVAVADAILNDRSFTNSLCYWCNRYPSSYGNMFAKWIENPRIGPYNSFGNGSAMRVSPCGWLGDLDAVMDYSYQCAVVTHNHPEGIKGAQCVADLIWRLRKGQGIEYAKIHAKKGYGYDVDIDLDQLRKNNTFDETCQVTVPQAIACFLQSTNFESAIRLAVSIGGDSDTIAAITGSLAEAYYGIPDWIKEKAMEYLPEDMIEVINKFYKKL